MIWAVGHQCFKSQEGLLSAALGDMKSKRRPERQFYLAPGQGDSPASMEMPTHSLGPQVQGCLHRVSSPSSLMGPWPLERIRGIPDMGQTS